MPPELPTSFPEQYRRFLDSALRVLGSDSRVVAIAAAGSFLSNSMDAFSDLDLVIAVEPGDYEELLRERQAIAASIAPLLAAFTGEHIGDSRVFICLYGPPPLHVDLKFVSLTDFVEHPTPVSVLWERDSRFSAALATARPVQPGVDIQWIEDRFWVWVHYAAGKIGRGELYEALELISLLRTTVLGPLALRAAGAQPFGVRRLEAKAPVFSRRLERTLARHDADACRTALRECAEIYRALRATHAVPFARVAAEQAAIAYLREVEQRLGISK